MNLPTSLTTIRTLSVLALLALLLGCNTRLLSQQGEVTEAPRQGNESATSGPQVTVADPAPAVDPQPAAAGAEGPAGTLESLHASTASSQLSAAPPAKGSGALSTWHPKFPSAQDAVAGDPAGFLYPAFVAWRSSLGIAYEAWLRRLGAEPSALELLDAQVDFYRFHDAAGQPVPVLTAPYSSSMPRGLQGVHVEGGTLHTFVRLDYPAVTTIQNRFDGSKTTRSYRPEWADLRPAFLANHLQQLLHSYARIYGELPPDHATLLRTFYQVPVNFTPLLSEPPALTCGLVARLDQVSGGLYLHRVPAPSPKEADVIFFRFDWDAGEVHLERRPLSQVPEAASWPVFLAAELSPAPLNRP